MLHEIEEEFQLALQAGRMGTWDWNVRTGAVTWSPNLEAIHGLPRGASRALLPPSSRRFIPTIATPSSIRLRAPRRRDGTPR